MIAKLSLQLVRDTVQGGGHIVGFGVGAEGLARDEQGGFYPLEAVEPRVVLGDEFEIDADGSRLHALQTGELVAGDLTDLVRDLQVATREGQLHVRRSPPLVHVTGGPSPG